jgi:hypothetical protein
MRSIAMNNLPEWAESFASETLHSWMLKGYPNLLNEVKEVIEFAYKKGWSDAVKEYDV